MQALSGQLSSKLNLIQYQCDEGCEANCVGSPIKLNSCRRERHTYIPFLFRCDPESDYVTVGHCSDENYTTQTSISTRMFGTCNVTAAGTFYYWECGCHVDECAFPSSQASPPGLPTTTTTASPILGAAAPIGSSLTTHALFIAAVLFTA